MRFYGRLEKKISSLLDQMIKINNRLDTISKSIETLTRMHQGNRLIINDAVLLNLPDTLQKTMKALSTLGEADATSIRSITGASRTSESTRLRELEGRGLTVSRFIKGRRGRRIIYCLRKEK